VGQHRRGVATKKFQNKRKKDQEMEETKTFTKRKGKEHHSLSWETGEHPFWSTPNRGPCARTDDAQSSQRKRKKKRRLRKRRGE